MALDPQSQQIFVNHLHSKLKRTPKCCLCDNEEWLPGEMLGLSYLTGMRRDDTVDKGVVPHVSLTCANCGYVLLFSAQVAGMVLSGERPSLN